MTIKTLTGTYSAGYALSPVYSALRVASSASIGGAGITAAAPASVNNRGSVLGGVNLATGLVENHGTITGHISTFGGENIGGGGVAIEEAGVVANYGNIYGGAGGSYTGGSGVSLGGGGTLFNTAGVIEGGSGKTTGGAGLVVSTVAASLANSARIYGGSATGGRGGYGIEFLATADITNSGVIAGGAGSGSNRGGPGAYLLVGGTLYNSGSISGGAGGVVLPGGAGAAAGVQMVRPGSITNIGSVYGGGTGGAGVILSSGGSISNGNANNAGALIKGYVGVQIDAGSLDSGVGTLTNYGTIDGTGGVSVQFGSSDDRLIAEPGSSFTGSVEGDGGTLELVGGTGAIAGLGGAGTLSGAVSADFSDFGLYDIDAGGFWTLEGANTLSLGHVLQVDGDLMIAACAVLEIAGSMSDYGPGPLENDGKIKVAGGAAIIDNAITGTGKVKINGGVFEANSSFSQNVVFNGSTGELVLADSQSYGGSISGFSTNGRTSLDLLDIKFVSDSQASFVGTSSGGTLTVTDGTNTAHITLVGDYLGSTFTTSRDGYGDTIVVDPPARPPSALSQASGFVQAMATVEPKGAGGSSVSSLPMLSEARSLPSVSMVRQAM